MEFSFCRLFHFPAISQKIENLILINFLITSLTITVFVLSIVQNTQFYDSVIIYTNYTLENPFHYFHRCIESLIDHSILIKKLRYYGIRNSSCDILISYLILMIQYLAYLKYILVFLMVLGPLLFFI